MSPMPRSERIRRHANRRARERLGAVPDEKTVARIARLLRRRIRRPPNRPLNDVVFEHRPQSRYARITATVFLDGTRFRVVYEPATNLIVTFLPVECGI